MVTFAQLRELGFSRHRVESEIRLDRWTQVAPTVVVLQNSALTRSQALWLGVLHAGPTSVLTHLTACLQGGLRWVSSDSLIHVLTAKSDDVSPLPGIRFHQTRRPYLDWRYRGEGVPRLGLDHAALLTAERDRSLRRGIGLLAAVVQQGLSTADRLVASSTDIRKLRHGAELRLALGDIAGGAQSFAEIDVGRLCRERGLQPPRRQRVRTDASGRRRYLDCEWILPDGRVVVLEIDGSFHMRVEHWTRDMKRERAEVISGRTVLRCSSIEVRLQPGEVLDDLQSVGVPTIFVPEASA